MNRNKYASLVGLLGFLIASCTTGGDGGDQESTDLILSGAKIVASNRQQPWAKAVAVKNGRFIYVGDSAGVAKYRSDSTQSVDLKGRLVIPGLVDSHVHPGYIDVEQYGDISETKEDMLAAVKTYADEHPDVAGDAPFAITSGARPRHNVCCKNTAGRIFSGTWACKAFESGQRPFPNNELAYVQDGSITLTDAEGAAQAFNAGDAFFIPEGVECAATVANDVRLYISVIKSD